MDVIRFLDYLEDFEHDCCAQLLGNPERVYLSNQKLESTVFGWILNSVRLSSGEVFVIDYYGLKKRSQGFVDLANDLINRQSGQIRNIYCSVVNFSSIKVEQVAMTAPNLVKEFPIFKERLLLLRKF